MNSNSGFPGFPAGRFSATAIPNVFFTEILPAIASAAELKVTLHVFWRLGVKRGVPRFLSIEELEGDATLVAGLGTNDQSGRAALHGGLAAAVARGTLLRAAVPGRAAPMDVVVANSPQGRAALAELTEGNVIQPDSKKTIDVPPARPTVFELYEQNVGLLTPILADELADASSTYPAIWLEDAIRLAVTSNHRNWRYIRAILNRWANEGRNDDQTTRRRATKGRAAGYKGWQQTYQPNRRQVSDLR